MFYIRIIFIVGLMSQLLACSSLLEHKLTQAQGAPMMQPFVLEHIFQQQRFCHPDSPHSSEPCLRYFDLDVTERIASFASNMELNLDKEGMQLTDQITFSLKAPPDQAPLAVIFPGYSMHATDMVFYASWLNDLGFFPIIADGPTYQTPFDFGQGYASQLALALSTRYPDRPVLLLGFSMGASSLEPFISQHQKVLGAIAIAPMQDFQATGKAVFERARQRRVLLRLLPEAAIEQALANILSKSQLTAEQLNFNHSASRLPTPLLVISGELDWISPPASLEAGASFTHIQLPYQFHESLLHPWPEIRQETLRWLESEQLPFQLVHQKSKSSSPATIK